MQSEIPDPRNLIINYIPTPVTDKQLESLFEPYGKIQTARVIRDRITNHPKGYGFVKYEEVSSATEAILKMDKYVIGNKRLKVSHATGKEKKNLEHYTSKSKNNENYQTQAQSMPNIFSAMQNNFTLQGNNTSQETFTGIILSPQPSFTAIPILVQPEQQQQQEQRQQELQRSLEQFLIPAYTFDQKKMENMSTAHIPAETSNAPSQEHSSYSLTTSQTFIWSPDNANLTLQNQTKPQYELSSDSWQINQNENKNVSMSNNRNFTENYVIADADKSEVIGIYSLHNANTSNKNDSICNSSYSKVELSTNNIYTIDNNNSNNNNFSLKSSALPVLTCEEFQRSLVHQQEQHENSFQKLSSVQLSTDYLQAYTIANSNTPSLASYTAVPISSAAPAAVAGTTTTTTNSAHNISTSQLPLLPTVMLAQPNNVLQNTIPCISLPPNQQLSQPLNSVQLLQPQPYITAPQQCTLSQSTPSLYSVSNEMQMVNTAHVKGTNEQNVNTSNNSVFVQFQGQPLELLTSQSMPAYFSSPFKLEHAAQQNALTVMTSTHNKMTNENNSLLKPSEIGSINNTFVIESDKHNEVNNDVFKPDAFTSVTNSTDNNSHDSFSVFGNVNINNIMPDCQADSSATSANVMEQESAQGLSFVPFCPRTPMNDASLDSNSQSQYTSLHIGSDMSKFSTQTEFVNSQHSYGLTPYANVASQSAHLAYMNDTINVKIEPNAQAPKRLAFSNSSITEASNINNNSMRNICNSNVSNCNYNNNNQNWGDNSNNYSSSNLNFLNTGTNYKLQTARTSNTPLTDRMDNILQPSISKPNEQENQFALHPVYRYQ